MAHAVRFEDQQRVHRLVEEVPVVGRHHERAGVVGQGLLEGLPGEDVEVIGRFVEYQEVRLLEDQLGQGQAALLAPAQQADLLEDVVGPEQEPAEEVADRAFVHGGPDRPEFVQHGALARQAGPFLVVVADVHARAEADGPRRRRLLSHDHAEQGGLPGPVVADQAHAVAEVLDEVQAREQRPRAVALGQVFQHEDVPAAALHRSEVQRGRAVLRPRLLDALQTRQVAAPALGLFGLDALDGPADELLALLDEGLLLVVLALPRLEAFGLDRHGLGVVAGKVFQAQVLQFGDPVHGPVEKVAVVGNEQDRRRVVGDVLLQPLRRGHVQVAFRLVQEQQVRIAQQQLAQAKARLLSPAQHADGQGQVVIRKAQAVQHGPGTVLAGVAASPFIGFFEASVLPQPALGLFRVAFGLLQRRLGLAQLPFQFVNALEAAQRLVQDGVGGGQVRVLGQVADPEVAAAGDFALVRRQVAGDELQHGRLPGPVGADQAHVLTGVDAPADALQDTLRAIVFRDFMEGYERHG